MARARRTLRETGTTGVRAWTRRHAFSLLSSLGSLARYPLASLMTVAVVAFAIAMPLALHLALDNIERAAKQWERLDTLSVFLEIGIDQPGVDRLTSRLSTWPAVLAVDPISPQQGLDELSRQLGLEPVDDLLADNPLPWVLEVTLAAGTDRAALIQRLQANERVDSVLVDLRWLERLDAMTDVLGQLAWLLAVLLAAGVAVVIGNTIRLDVQNRREEIEVMALVGATAAFIRRPFLYSGLWYGLLGGLLAWAMIAAGLMALAEPVARLGQTYGEPVRLLGPAPAIVVAAVGGSALFGLLGAWLAVSQHLRRIDP
ncbi:permease-like cell division protein FtsX [Wenzhouxiangella limi]|uniref:Cell division protein FtsX n=1 Tax=Wenzhouxiangella limi TaxID=2707351 RepID=A0A845V799_9GAMM|nr:permease-like cell division protein FtsX [Wenzhouxiangella limi]NDY97026.1 ABC transporter permease [Wenzhouxiangella limi]